MFADPLGTVSVALPPSWAFDPLSSSLTRLAFVDWTDPRVRRLFVDVGATFHFGVPGDSDAEWERIVRNELKEILPIEPTRIERRPGPVILVEVPPSEHHPGARLAWMRGIRLGVFVEQQGSPAGGALYTPELEEAVRTIDVPANRHIAGKHTKSDWQSEIHAAVHARQAADDATAHNHFEQAIAVARCAWLNSFVIKRAPPDIPAAVAQAEATLGIGAIEQSVVRLYHATTTLFRCRVSLRSLPLAGTSVSDRVEELLSLALKIHSQLEGSNATIENPVQACMVRSRLCLRDFASVSKDRARASRLWVALSNMAALACEDAMTAAALSALGESRRFAEMDAQTRAMLAARGVSDEVGLQKLFREEKTQIMDLFSDAAHALSSVELAFASVSARAVKANAVFAARSALAFEPSQIRQSILISVMIGYVGALFELGDQPSLQEAQSLISEAQALLDQMGDESESRAILCTEEAQLCYLQKRTEEGLTLADQAISLFASLKLPRKHEASLNEALSRATRSRLLIQAGRAQEALEEAHLARAATVDPVPPAILLSLAMAYHHTGDPESAKNQIRIGLSAALALNPMSGDVQTLLSAAVEILEPVDVMLSLAATEAAELLLDVRRADVGEATEQISYDDQSLHRELAASLVKRRLDAHDTLGALVVADRHRARSLAYGTGLPGMPGAHHYTMKPPPKAETSLSEQISYIAETARSVQKEWGMPRSLGNAEITNVIVNHGRRLVLFQPVGELLQAFVVRPALPLVINSVVAKVPFRRILELADELRRQLGITVAARAARGELPEQSLEKLAAAFVDEDDIQQADRELDRLRRDLHDALFSEVLPLLRTGEPLVIVPYRELSVVPLAVLSDAGKQPLVERHPLSVLPSLASLAALRSPSAGLPRAVVVGDPMLPVRSGLPPLTGAAREAGNIRQMLESSGVFTIPLLGPDATEEKFRTHVAGARIVHLACHAALREPVSASPLFLAPSQNDDGLLLPAEIADLQLDGALVVLSACQSGLGRVTADGVLGLGRAFMQAGARVVVLSLWRVSDLTTASLMQAFYSALTGKDTQKPDRLDVASALRHAQRVVRQHESEHPSFWASWLVIGDGSWRLPLGGA